jgi:ABC-2 type transport system ATP-binding protein
VIIINQGKIVLDKSLESLRDNQQQIIEVSFDYRLEIEALARLPKVQKVINTHDFVYEIYVSGRKDQRTEIFDFANENGLKILSLQQKNQSLEELFNELTSS